MRAMAALGLRTGKSHFICPLTSELRVLSASSALKMAVEVGLVVGTTPAGEVGHS